MKEQRVGAAHCHIRGGSLNEEGLQIVEKSMTSHNLINKIDIIVPNNESDKVESSIKTMIVGAETYVIESMKLYGLLSLVLSLNREDRFKISCYANKQQVDHEESISIVRGMLHLKLTSEVYYSSGLLGKESQFCAKSGVSSKNNQFKLFKLDFNLCEFQEMIDKKDLNYIRLLWFAEQVFQNRVFEFVVSHIDENVLNSFMIKEYPNIKYTNFKPVINKRDLGIVKIPSLKPVIDDDESWVSDTLEWIVYSSQEDSQLGSYDNTDGYISRYREMNEDILINEMKLTKFSITNGLFNGCIDLKELLMMIIPKIGKNWFTLISYGLKDVNVSYGLRNEHGFTENGENDSILLKNEDNEYVIWDVVGFGDSR